MFLILLILSAIILTIAAADFGTRMLLKFHRRKATGVRYYSFTVSEIKSARFSEIHVLKSPLSSEKTR